MSFHPQMPYGTPAWHTSARTLPDEGPAFEFTAEHKAQFDELVARYPADRRRSALLPALYLVQAQQGHITGNAMVYVAGLVGCSRADVEDVVSYYVMFFTQPVGTYVLGVCRTLGCALNGAGRVTEELCKHLHIAPNETDATGTFTVIEMECLGACDRGPVIMVNNEHWHECQRPEDVPQLLEGLRERGLAALSGCHLKKE